MEQKDIKIGMGVCHKRSGKKFRVIHCMRPITQGGVGGVVCVPINGSDRDYSMTEITSFLEDFEVLTEENGKE